MFNGVSISLLSWIGPILSQLKSAPPCDSIATLLTELVIVLKPYDAEIVLAIFSELAVPSQTPVKSYLV